MRELVTADFLVLPCDLICELGGEKLLQAWMVKAASLADLLEEQDLGRNFLAEGGAGAETRSKSNGNGYATHSGGLGVWYDTRTGIPAVKSEEKDFVATVPLSKPAQGAAAAASSDSKTAPSVVPHLERVVTAMPTDSLNDLTEEKNGYPTRHGLLRRHRALRMRTTHRDAHIYVFPHWVMDFVQANEHMDSIGEDVLGWWAKAEWQRSLPEKLGVGKALQTYCAPAGGDNSDSSSSTGGHDGRLPSSTSPSRSRVQWARSLTSGAGPTSAASTFVAAAAITTPSSSADNVETTQPATTTVDEDQRQQMPPLLAYVHPSAPTAPLIRRVDTSQLLLTVSLQLAKLPSVEETALAAGVAADSAAALALSSPFAHTKKVAYPEGVKPRTTVTRPDSLVADNVTVEEKVSIKECVIGANCQIQEGAKLHQCLLMEGVVVGKGARLTRCILGKRSEIGAQSVLVDCEVQENLLVEPKSRLPSLCLRFFYFSVLNPSLSLALAYLLLHPLYVLNSSALSVACCCFFSFVHMHRHGHGHGDWRLEARDGICQGGREANSPELEVQDLANWPPHPCVLSLVFSILSSLFSFHFPFSTFPCFPCFEHSLTHIFLVPTAEEKDNNFMSSEGLEATAEELDEAMQDVSDDDVAVGGV